MNREEIKQKVFDALGIILVDKSMIHEDATFIDLAFEDDDIECLFAALGEVFNFAFPDQIKEQAITKPEDFSLHMIIELILLMGNEGNKTKVKPGHRH
ncbi:hypothetical protein [Pseudomonas amygdali]|uniref:hypothetical protein n=1 Tax=Pseudomonas amygdali TaxID=47877 RepID=UPI0006B9751B|nr:hypothetical protein [Pseudomonas amygdali]KPB18634.1 Uncharacterized protein AC516_3539 [Pseudomonas amygdali pv. sesami]KPY60263.1 Uncharacterized protein ALO93_04267 [Pseudomonas amygdali pv. sesami]RMT91545.1 hypothetical protein ALP38_03541 [Pseudomonas amygdali pv. sesami]RMU02174.1 hypothetical protein ALP37_00650 [Pseudomonas amygdali pv. sesami]RMV76398.1 hypothetical protein ALP04_02210 [Pseudomonas amygdali pv. sesami]